MAGWPSTMITQQPQEPSGAQPSLTDTTPHSSRRTSRNCIPGSYEASTAFPFRLNAILGIGLPSMVSSRGYGGPNGSTLENRQMVHQPLVLPA